MWYPKKLGAQLGCSLSPQLSNSGSLELHMNKSSYVVPTQLWGRNLDFLSYAVSFLKAQMPRNSSNSGSSAPNMNAALLCGTQKIGGATWAFSFSPQLAEYFFWPSLAFFTTIRWVFGRSSAFLSLFAVLIIYGAQRL